MRSHSSLSRSLLPHPISDSIWLAHGSLLVGSGHQMVLFGRSPQPRPIENEEPPDSLFEHVARLNGPLGDCHPQMLLQCLLWGKPILLARLHVHYLKVLQTKWN